MGRERAGRRLRALALSLGVLAAALAVVPGAQAVPTITLQQSADTAPVGQGVNFTATATTDDAAELAPLSYAFGDGATATAASGTTVTHPYGAAGTYAVTITATDVNGGTATATSSVRVVGNLSAAFSFAPEVPNVGDAVTFDAGASNDQGGPIASYAWSFGDGATGTGAKPSHKYASAGDKTVTLAVATPDGRTATVSRTLHVNAPPKAGFDIAPSAPVTGDTVTFTSSASDPDGAADLATITWDLNGDGRFNDATGAKVTAVFLTSGTYTIRQRVIDKNGDRANTNKTLEVKGPPAPAPPPPVTPTVSSQPVAVVPSPGAPIVSTPAPTPFVVATSEETGTGTQGTLAPPAQALKLLRVRIQLAGTVTTTRTRITRLLVFAPQGALVVARCSGKRQGCPAAGLRKKVRTEGRVRLSAMERRLRTGARIVVSVTKAGFATRRVVLTMRAGKAPSRKDACMQPAGDGKAKEVRCPAA